MKGKKQTSAPTKASTQVFLEIEDVIDDIVVMKDFSASTIIEVGAVNFWLLSQDEQNAIITSYGSLLNSLSFPIQILILSKRMDISSYIEYLREKIEKQKDENLKKRLGSYQEFIQSTVKKSTVLEKRFFFVIPFSPLELGVTKGFTSLTKEYIVSRAKVSLYPKRDHLLRLLTKLGLKGQALKKQAVVELFYNLYNPSSTGRQLGTVEGYTDVVLTS